ncbi:hypothetical protein DB30_02099 [Enhygromyxa salina]|uniref:Membrane protein insertase YidC n=1 Tax=Enhygromyxa salina TaxID=215803 RepID=A0A0C1Z363_9BACT|nr:hypothetical protein [Enhygromyxa salina]KIG12044.1 hypothetical protein DB30_02099 [Enhygromyxa salina]
METLKNFAVPLVALVLLLVWFFVIRPMLGDTPVEPEPAAKSGEPAEPAKPAEPPASQ